MTTGLFASKSSGRRRERMVKHGSLAPGLFLHQWESALISYTYVTLLKHLDLRHGPTEMWADNEIFKILKGNYIECIDKDHIFNFFGDQYVGHY